MNQRKRPESGSSKGRATETPKRLGRRSAEESRETRRALLDAAVVEFSEKGMNGARIDDIAERAGVTKGAIYTHFDGREDLLVEACRSAIQSLQVMRVTAEAADLSTFVDETARRLLAPEARSARLLISELYTSAMRSDVIAELLAEWHAEFVDTIEDRVPSGAASPQAVALALNFLNVALSHIDVYESMDVGADDLLALVNRLATAVLSNTEPTTPS
ncbi:MAG: TetR family transcriptional regulator [Actinomycetota bacterium]